MSTIQQIRFFEKQVYMPEWKNSMSGKNEERCLSLLKLLGYEVGKDFVRQHPILEIRVVDFCFLNERVVIEIDGYSHNNKRQRNKDSKTDSFLRSNGWDVLRIKDNDLFGEKGSFWKNIIKEVISEKREAYNEGRLFEIECKKTYDENDYN